MIHRILMVLALALPFFLVVQPFAGEERTASAQGGSVVVVWDATQEADCQLSVSTDGGKAKSIPCPPGSVIYAKQTSREDAASISGGEIVEMTSGRGTPAAVMDQAVQDFHDSVAPMLAAAQASCNKRNRSVDGSYVVDGRYRVHYSMKYKVKKNCNVSGVSDRGWTVAAGSGRAQWEKSCSNGNSSCSARNIILSTSPTAWKNVPNSQVNRQYRHQSFDAPACSSGICINAYGFWYFD